VFEVFGKYLILEEFFIFDNEAVAIIGPFYDMAVLLLFEYFIGFYYEIGYLLLSMDAFLVDYLL
jgi:hypothetical protein